MLVPQIEREGRPSVLFLEKENSSNISLRTIIGRLKERGTQTHTELKERYLD